MDRVVFIGDTHCGGHHGLYPLDRLPPHLPWTGTRYLMQCWAHMASELADYPRDRQMLVVMGDVIEGKNRKSAGAGLHTGNLGEQSEAAIEAWAPIADLFGRVMRVDGTPYHEDYEKHMGWFDDRLDIERSGQVLNLRIDPKNTAGSGVLNIAHHPAGGSALYLGTKMDRQTLWAAIQASWGQIPEAQWIVRAHLHEFATFRRKGKTMVQNPCWKLSDFYATKLDYERFQPDLGWTELRRDPTDPSGWRVLEHLYDSPLDVPSLEVIDV